MSNQQKNFGDFYCCKVDVKSPTVKFLEYKLQIKFSYTRKNIFSLPRN